MKFTNAYKYTMILVFLLLTSCSPSLEYTGVGGDILSPITNLFTIEAEKSGTPFDTETQTIRVGESLDLYFRDSIGSTENTDKLMATWSLFNGPGTMLVQEGGLSVRYNATSAGTVEVHAEHDDIKKYVIITILPAATSPTNTPPTISENCLNFFPGEDYKCQLSISDNDSSSFVWSEISDSCNYFSLNKSTGEITGTIPINPLPTCSLTIKANDGIDDSNQLAISINEQLCPTGYVPVPGNETLGTTSFCVMQFEAKNVSGVATSQAGSTPWGFIDSSTAFSECSSLSESGFDGNFSLISNRERMTINYNIENEAMNWSGGVVGSGHIPRGHSDNNPAIYLDVADINDPYIGTGNWSGQTPGAGWEQKRVHVMNNGYQIWDLAGNLWEWADWDHKKSGLTLSPNHNEAGVLNELSVNPSGSLNTLEYKPINDTYGTANSFGTWRAGGVAGAIIRGGFKDSDSNSIPGLYTFLITTPTHSYSNFGFRCVYRPSQPPVAQNFSAPNPYENTERIITLDYYDVNYNQASSCTIENLTNVTETTPCTCDGSGVCTVGITGITNYSGPASFEFNVIADGLKSNNAQANFSINGSIACPTGFVHVIGNASLGTDDFCVMQFEAKNNAGTPISQASGTPWVNISATNAFNECASMTESGFNG
ncbi:MAG: hypothetical protein VX341_10520, partial [Bdellovibrionota bacterium]|nr:hypothetical protein [Bdellovibrionota bacterium]